MLRARVAAVCVDLDQHLGGIGDARSRCYISVCRCTLYYRIGNIRAFGFVGVGTYSRMDWREPNVSALSAQKNFKKREIAIIISSQTRIDSDTAVVCSDTVLT